MELVLEKLERREKHEEENDFFICKDCQVLFTFPQAMSCDFNCPGCGTAVTHFDNEMLLKSLKQRIGDIKKSLGHATPTG
jgi:transcription initiation factor TFIIE subunit alpha